MKVLQKDTLMPFLLQTMKGASRNTVKKHLKNNSVFVNGRSVTRFDHSLQPGDEVSVEKSRLLAEVQDLKSELGVIHEDDALLVIEKPAGLLSVSTEKNKTETAFAMAYDYLKKSSAAKSRSHKAEDGKPVYIVHRLDREVSGVMVLAKTLQAKVYLQEQWADFEKKYAAVVDGRPPKDSDTLTHWLRENRILQVVTCPGPRPGAKQAITIYRLSASGPRRSLLEITLGTGRKHQIRVQLAETGCPVSGDKVYGEAGTNSLGRMALHAISLRLKHPITHTSVTFRSPMPEGFKRLLQETT